MLLGMMWESVQARLDVLSDRLREDAASTLYSNCLHRLKFPGALTSLPFQPINASVPLAWIFSDIGMQVEISTAKLGTALYLAA